MGCGRARDEVDPSEGLHTVSTGLEVSFVGACAAMTPFLVGVAAVLSETASIYGLMASCPLLPRRKEVASSAKGGGSPIGSQYEPARQYG